ncbi:MAG: flagellar motor switch protein FliG [bacterium]|jgi:flagellar motor switch protein FliG
MPGTPEKKPMSGRRKAATLMLILGAENASQVYRYLSDREIEQITMEIANLGTVPSQLHAEVIEEFYHTAMARQYINHGGIGIAQQILSRALGEHRALEIIERLQGSLRTNAFDFLQQIDSENLLTFLQHEHPQTIALILSHLSHDKAASVLSLLNPHLQNDVAIRIATMESISPDIIADIERIMEKKVASLLTQEFSQSGGVETLAEMLNRLDRMTSKALVHSLEEQNHELAAEVKKQMFTFDDLTMLDDRTVQLMLRHINMKELALALKGANDDVRNLFFSNMSSRAAENLRDDMDTMGPVRLKQVEETQQKIITIIRQLEEAGEITIIRPGEAERLI